MKSMDDFMSLEAVKISSVDTHLGYMQLLEYKLQDLSYLHVLQWNFSDITVENEYGTIVPNVNCLTFYNDVEAAFKKALEVGNMLLLPPNLA